ncbi:hypothetical protein [Streptomyces tubercidicus]|uniref:hypothetical protein n=1 Tax=Streptomyces tubercidicus TaxID=47759 RepID=UPI003465AA19
MPRRRRRLGILAAFAVTASFLVGFRCSGGDGNGIVIAPTVSIGDVDIFEDVLEYILIGGGTINVS